MFYMQEFLKVSELHLCLLVMSSQPPLKKAVFFYIAAEPQAPLKRRFFLYCGRAVSRSRPIAEVFCYNHSMTKRMHIMGIPGAGMNAGAWGGLAPHLTEFYFEPLSLPGHYALSGGKPLPTLAEMVDFVRNRLDGTPEKSIVLMGHSMGALLAMEAAAHAAVAGIVLMGAAQKMPVHQDLLAAAKDDLGKAVEMIIKWGVFRDHPQIGAMRMILAALMREPEPDALYWDLRACNDYQGAPAACNKPVLVIAGEDDKLTPPAESMALAEHLQGKYVAFPSCGHMMMIEKPLETAGEISRFIREIGD